MDNLTKELEVLRTEKDEIKRELIRLINILTNENYEISNIQKNLHKSTDDLCNIIDKIKDKKFLIYKNTPIR